ncbi:unnamed protein product, partial [Ilex paraguariensis]
MSLFSRQPKGCVPRQTLGRKSEYPKVNQCSDTHPGSGGTLHPSAQVVNRLRVFLGPVEFWLVALVLGVTSAASGVHMSPYDWCATHVHVRGGYDGVRFTKMSTQIEEKVDSNSIIGENLQELPLSSAYETAMEVLSSLITRQKRGTRSAVDGKYKKLDRMLMYIK